MLKFVAGIVFSLSLVACSDYSPEITGTNSNIGTPTVAASGTEGVSLAKAEVGAAPATSGAQYVAGKHYRVLDRPVPTANPNKVEIAEFFWYGCSHCYTFEPLINDYKKAMPDNYAFVGVPAMWRDVMVVHAKAYYATKALNRPDLHDVIFDEMNNKGNRLASPKAVAKLFAEHGVDEEKTLRLLNSFGVNAQVNKARAVATGAKLTGTPTLLVNGKYMIEARGAGGQAAMIRVADYLAKKESAN